MKILQINVVYNKGSTGKITYNLYKAYKEYGFDSFVIYGRGKSVNDPCVFKLTSEFESKIHHTLSLRSGNLYGGMYFSTKRIIKFINKLKPDIIHLQCLNGYFINIYKLITYLKETKIKTILTLHAEFMYSANCGYTLGCKKYEHGCQNCLRVKEFNGSKSKNKTAKYFCKMKQAFAGFNNLHITSVSPWLMSQARLSPILKSFSHSVILNGVDISKFQYRNDIDVNEIKTKYNIPLNKKILIHVTPNLNQKEKGGYHIFELAKRMELKDYIFVIVGCDKQCSFPNNIINIGKISNQEELSKLYQIAEATLIVSEAETFSMPVAESLCSGTPVVGFKCGGPESITISQYSSFVENGNYDALINSILSLPQYNRSEISNNAKEKFDDKIIALEYVKLMEK